MLDMGRKVHFIARLEQRLGQLQGNVLCFSLTEDKELEWIRSQRLKS